MSPHDVALKFDHRDVADLLVARSSPRVRLMNALLAGDENAANAAAAEAPSLVGALTADDHGRLAYAIFHERFVAADLMLRFGFDPAAPGIDGGTALHAACWVGSVRMVERLLSRGGVALDARDPTHQSTPLGWAAFGSVHRRARGSDYPGVAARLIAAGADVKALGNGAGRTLLEMAQGNPDMQEALRHLGAS
jgi:ankyrin repeat protein